MSSPSGMVFNNLADLNTVDLPKSNQNLRPSILKNGSKMALRQQKSDNTPEYP